MSKYSDTSVEQIEGLYNEVKASFDSHKTRSLDYRKTQLRALAFLIQDNEQALIDAVHQDLNRVGHETVVAEIIPTIHEVKEALNNLDKWAKPVRVKTTAAWALAKATLTSVPKGIALIISPWNFPLSLSLGPLVGAISAGCPAIIKPAEQTPAVSALLADLIPRYLDQSSYKVVLGAIPQATRLLELRWDLIFYTGSGTVGRIVATAAAKNLTPVVLELGGKSPAIVLDDCNVEITARRLMWGKWTNAGQICIAPDYVLCSASMQPKLVEAMRKAITEFTGPAKSQSSVGNDQYSKLIAPSHYARIDSLLSKTKGSIAIGGTRDEKRQKIDVTVVTDVKADDALMEGEIFGPVLPIMTMSNVEQMIRYVNKHDNPLALYVFTSSNAKSKHVFDHTRSGSYVHNDCLIQFGLPGLPFGGAGPSGYGEYHGKFSFDAFSHKRSSASMPPFLDVLLAARYPPYSMAKLKRLSLMTRETVTRSTGSSSLARLFKVISALLVVITAYKRLLAK